jgi:hypothetical protein
MRRSILGEEEKASSLVKIERQPAKGRDKLIQHGLLLLIDKARGIG